MHAPWSRSPGAEPRRQQLPWRGLVAVSAVLLVLGVAALPSPYAIEQPGPVYNTLGSSGKGEDRAPLISIPGRTTYPTSGRLDLLTVLVNGTPAGRLPWIDLAAAWLDPTKAVIPLEAVFPQGVSVQEATEQSAAQMTASQQSAISAALTTLGYDVTGRVRVGIVRSGTAAAGRLQVGDVITSFDGEPVLDSCSLQDSILAHGTQPASVVVTRDGASRTVTVTPRAVDDGTGGTRPFLGAGTTATMTYPFTVRLRIDDVGGPSAGMMFALGIVDKLTPGALTGGRHVAGTGTICGDGQVGPIGGIAQKMSAARAAGATLFLAPAGNCDEVVGHIPGGLDVVPVTTLSGALEVLDRVDAQGSTKGLATCAARVGSPG